MFLGFGEVMARIAPEGHARWRQSVPGRVNVTWGGGEANVCASLAMLGNRARYMTALPRNPLAVALADSLRGLGVDTSSILWRDSGRLGLYFVEKGANQRPSSVVYDRQSSAVSLATPDEYDWNAILDGVNWLHVTGITPAISETAFQANLALAQRAKEKGVSVSCDLNYRKKLWRWKPDTEPRDLARQCMEQLLPSVDVVVGNEEDAADVLGVHAGGSDVAKGHLDAESYRRVAATICERFPNVSKVAITLRQSVSADVNRWGAMLYDAVEKASYFAPQNADGQYQPYEIRDIVDRVGAGDSFCAGLLHALHDGDLEGDREVIAFATAASCLKHSIPGDFNYTAKEEVLALMGGDATGRVKR